MSSLFVEAIGNHELAGSANGNAVKTTKANSRAEDLVQEEIAPLRAQGASLRAIATHLTSAGIPAPRGGAWSATAVMREINRAA